MSSFMEICLEGLVSPSELQDTISDFIDEWHSKETHDTFLHEFLGMTRVEYDIWLVQPELLPYIVLSRIRKIDEEVQNNMREISS